MEPQDTAPTPAAPAAPQKPTVTVPVSLESWPGAFGLYKYSKAAVMYNVGTVVALIVLEIVLNIGLSLALKNVGGLIADVITVFLSVALVRTYLAGARGQKLSFNDSISGVKPMVALKYLGQSIVTGLLLIVSFLLLIVPFFFVLPRLLLASYFLIDKNMGPIESIKASWAATKGHAGMMWGIIGAQFVMALLCITIIGIPFAIYFLIMYSAAAALAYTYLTAAQQASQSVVNEPVSPQAPQAPTLS